MSAKPVDRFLAMSKILPLQADLPLPTGHTVEVEWPNVLDLAVEVANWVGRKEVAHDLGMMRARLDNALADRDRHPLHARALLYLILRDGDRSILRYLADLCGCELVEREPLTPEQQLERLLTEILPDECGPEQRARILRRLGR